MVTLERLKLLGFPCHNFKYYGPYVDVYDNEFEDYYKDNLCICSGDYAFPCQYCRTDAIIETLSSVHPSIA